ncbi:MAG: SRPBCC domain-containing protein, partial [Actinomycetota bacterium]
MTSNEMTIEPTILPRRIDALRQLVFDAWTKVEHLSNWMFPSAGFTCEYLQADIRPGGSSLHKISAPNGFEMWFLTRYEQIDPPKRLSFRQYMSNGKGDILPNPQMPDWPKEMRTTVELEQVGEETELRLIWEPVDATKEEADAFEASRAQHGEGWGGGLDQ